MSAAASTPLGVLEEQILVAVWRTREDAYGMQVRREIERVTERALAIGAVYATLDRLEEKGLVISRRLDRDGASRRIFAITARGARALADTYLMHERLWRGVDLRRITSLASV